jgi:hypothetical protein
VKAVPSRATQRPGQGTRSIFQLNFNSGHTKHNGGLVVGAVCCAVGGVPNLLTERLAGTVERKASDLFRVL